MRGLTVSKNFPFIFVVDAKHSFDDGCHLQTPDNEGEGFGSIRRKDLAVFDGEVVQRIDQVDVGGRLLLESDELSVVSEDKVARTPISDMFA